MSVLELPAPSHAWSFIRGIAVGLVLAAGGAGAFLVLSRAHVVFPQTGGTPDSSPAPKSDFDTGLDMAASKCGVTLDARMRRASHIYFAAFRAQRWKESLSCR